MSLLICPGQRASRSLKNFIFLRLQAEKPGQNAPKTATPATQVEASDSGGLRAVRSRRAAGMRGAAPALPSAQPPAQPARQACNARPAPSSGPNTTPAHPGASALSKLGLGEGRREERDPRGKSRKGARCGLCQVLVPSGPRRWRWSEGLGRRSPGTLHP